MKTFYSWNDMPLVRRLAVYDAYVEAHSRGDNAVLDFEEFDQLYNHHNFYSVAHKFGV